MIFVVERKLGRDVGSVKREWSNDEVWIFKERM